MRDYMQEYILRVMQPPDGPKDAPSFVQQCLAYMSHIKGRHQMVTERLSMIAAQAPGTSEDEVEITDFRRISLTKQHELLGFILVCLVKMNHSRAADFEAVLKTLQEWNTFNTLLGKTSAHRASDIATL